MSCPVLIPAARPGGPDELGPHLEGVRASLPMPHGGRDHDGLRSAHRPGSLDAGIVRGGRIQLARFRRLVAATVVIAVPLMAGCQEGSGAVASASPEATASARAAASPSSSATGEKTRADVVSDARFATKGFDGGLRIAKDPLKRECVVHATALSTGVPGKEELLGVVRGLELLGWHLDGEASMTEGTFLEAGEWSVTLGAGPVPDAGKAQASPNTGALAFGASGVCSRSPLPSPPLPLPLPPTP